jgi:hypothetical protein
MVERWAKIRDGRLASAAGPLPRYEIMDRGPGRGSPIQLDTLSEEALGRLGWFKVRASGLRDYDAELEVMQTPALHVEAGRPVEVYSYDWKPGAAAALVQRVEQHFASLRDLAMAGLPRDPIVYRALLDEAHALEAGEPAPYGDDFTLLDAYLGRLGNTRRDAAATVLRLVARAHRRIAGLERQRMQVLEEMAKAPHVGLAYDIAKRAFETFTRID